ncbi:MAG TPA: hypothetical protein VMB26_11225 [Candidatus Binataceae bacterium]|nr:hypothetical protein [Candidatus Binataceae bacterium]
MTELTPDQQKKIIEALEKKGAKNPCPRCGNPSFALLSGYFNQTLQTQLGGLVIGGPSVPSAVVACTNCGFLAQHALGALGLLPQEPKKEESK